MCIYIYIYKYIYIRRITKSEKYINKLKLTYINSCNCEVKTLSICIYIILHEIIYKTKTLFKILNHFKHFPNKLIPV